MHLMPEDKTATTVETTGCTEHDAEVFLRDLPPTTRISPAEGSSTTGRPNAPEHFRAIRRIGLPDVHHRHDVDDPDEGSWAHKDRAIVCLARPMDRSTLTSSVKDSGL